jgi:endonuclease/exonuclease/phosphatase family metal-dependent hydrolase
MDEPRSVDLEALDEGFRAPPDTCPVLARWEEHVGAPIALDLAPPLSGDVDAIDVLSWNLAMGEARLGEVLQRLLEAREGSEGGVPLVVLVQEAYRADDSVPARPPSRRHAGGSAAGEREDVVAVARALGLSLRYAPSMRNGAGRSDRGNAVLASVALGRAHAFSLPVVRQRRVAVAAELRHLPGLAFVSAHLENRKALHRGGPVALGLPHARAAQAARLARGVVAVDGPGSVVVGADLNAPLGERDPAFRALVAAGLTPAERVGPRGHTLHTALRLVLDWVLYHSPDGRVASVQVRRLDENPADRGPRVFGSDHHPLLARVRLATGGTAELRAGASRPAGE